VDDLFAELAFETSGSLNRSADVGFQFEEAGFFTVQDEEAVGGSAAKNRFRLSVHDARTFPD
jgi:hypothetical protein